ncbi:LOW QUALITY PROTEIN: trafficking kinesin-binding protein 2 [Centropristis striata]|uniref:LOW QUALITY PROTEIN: trafficking kinesin-binding protein 2 n=1 Tax=Centropristis striata TaxID=184440 RepID=UPI0027E00F37|nr:LOW QUALITY PROTEIN: trafficking kinesin-binding protein 2 [Centropristis striata]
MFEVKPRAVEKKESSTETDEGLGSSGKRFGSLGSGSADSGSVYLSDSQDWVVSPSCSPDEGPGQHSAISPLLAEETFRYMTYLALEPSSYSHPGSQSLSKVLSGDRVEQMAKTYNDIEVVSHLLAERDRDLELAARIGQSLLQRNHLLQERNEAIEEQLAQALDQVHQLQHELGKKDELLRMVASASEESETDSSVSTPQRHPQPLGGTTAAAALSQLESLQSKLQDLEEENLALRSEACQLKTDTITYEEKEQQLVSDCVKELRESNSQMVSLTDELSQKNEELLRHQEEIAQLLSQIVELQHRVKELALEKEELRIHLQASKEAQRQLTAELDELADRNAECVEMLHESQEEIRELRSKNTPSAGMRRHLSYGLYPMDSLAAEIEGTMRRELSVEEETAVQDQRVSQKRVFQTVRSINSSSPRPASAIPPIPGSGQSSLVMTAQPFQSTQGEEVRIGQPGCPGGNDLTKALHRLSLRRQNFLCERQFFQAEREKKLQALSGAEGDGEGSGCSTPMGSVLSSYSNLSELSFGSSVFKTFLPEKLQIVKPMEGSLTLHHWQQLAKPHLATILDPHPGVVTKGFRSLPQDAIDQDATYRLSDMEEDEEDEEHRGVQEKGAAERGKEEEDEEEEEGGITFKVRYSSTPEERRDRKHSVSPLPVPPLSPALSASPATPATSSSVRSDPRLLPEKSILTSQPIPGASTTVVQTSQMCISTSTTSSSVQNPGKCQSSTFSTYTFTTCCILHPSDITQVTPSSQSSLMANTPSSMRTGPSTPVTPCRLSLGDSFPPRRPPVHASGLAKLVLERGISAQVSTDTPPPSPKPTPRQPLFCLLPSTPPNSPSHSPSPSPIPVESRHHPADNFLASRPAELFLQDVYGLNLGRAPHPDLPSPSQGTPNRVPSPKLGRARPDLGLLERLRRLGFTKVLQGAESEAPAPRQDSATFVSTGGGSLLDGLRRNQSLPAMIGARAGKSAPPPHPTTLALPPTPWGNPKERRRQLASVSHFPSSSTKR